MQIKINDIREHLNDTYYKLEDVPEESQLFLLLLNILMVEPDKCELFIDGKTLETESRESLEICLGIKESSQMNNVMEQIEQWKIKGIPFKKIFKLKVSIFMRREM